MEPAQQSRATETLTGGHVGRFIVGECAGAGGMGEVYCAEDPQLRRKVALKRMGDRWRADPRYRQQFLREAERASRLSNPHVAGIYDVLEQGDDVFLVMEYVEGQTLRKNIQQRLPVSEALEIARQCADALRAAHQAGIVHCDIKPENIMLSGVTPERAAVVRGPQIVSEGSPESRQPKRASMQVKVLDFGVAKLLPGDDPSGSTIETDTCSVSGTPAYMAPEVVRGEKPDGRADIFSLGVVLYEVLAGRTPFRAETAFTTAERILSHDPPPLRELNPEVSLELEAIVGRMLAKNRLQRYANADELLAELEALESRPGFRTRPSRVIAGKKSPRNILVMAMALVLLIGIFLAGYKARVWRGIATAPRTRDIAILPFSAPDGDARTHAFSEGLAETVATRLTQLADRYPIQIVPPSEARLQGVGTTDQAKQLLGVSMVLMGSLRTAGDQIRVNYSLVDTGTRRQVSGGVITAQVSNPFLVEDRVVDGVLNTLEIALAPQDRHALDARRTAEPQAYDYYLQGRGYLQDYEKPENIASAIQVLQSALRLDPKYALAYAALGDAYWLEYDQTKDRRWLAKAQSACESASAADAGSAAANMCLGIVAEKTGELDKAIEHLRRAAALEPSNDNVSRWLATAYEGRQDYSQAEATYKQAVGLKPGYWGVYNALGGFYFRHGREHEALDMFQKVIALTPDNFRGYSNIGAVYLSRGDYRQALAYLQKSVAIRPTSSAYSNLGVTYFYLHRFPEATEAYQKAVSMVPADHILWGNLGEALYWTPGKQDEAQRALAQALKLADDDLRVNPKDVDTLQDSAGYYAMLGNQRKAEACLGRALALTPNDPETLAKAAIVNSLLGRAKESFEWLEKARAAGFGPERIRDDPAFDNLKGDSRFQAILTLDKR